MTSVSLSAPGEPPLQFMVRGVVNQLSDRARISAKLAERAASAPAA